MTALHQRGKNDLPRRLEQCKVELRKTGGKQAWNRVQNESRLAHFTKFSYNGRQGHGDAGRGTEVQEAVPQSFPGPPARPEARLAVEFPLGMKRTGSGV